MYLNQIWYQDVPHIPFTHAKFEGNLIMHLHFMAVFCKRAKKEEKKPKKILFEGLYFKNGWHDLLQIWYVFSPNLSAPAQQI